MASAIFFLDLKGKVQIMDAVVLLPLAMRPDSFAEG